MNDEEVILEAKNEIDEAEEEKSREQAYYEERPIFGKKGPSKLRQQFSRGMTYFLVVAASILFYFALLRLSDLSLGVVRVFAVLKPVVYGCVIAYLLNPIVNKVDQYLVPFLEKRMPQSKKVCKLSRGTGILLALILLIMVVSVLFNLLIPELYTSIRNLVFTLPKQLSDVLNNLNEAKFDDSTTGTIIKTVIEEGTDMFMRWMRTDLLNMTNEIMSNLTEGVFSVVSGF